MLKAFDHSIFHTHFLLCHIFRRFGLVFTTQHTTKNGSGNLMVVMLFIQTGTQSNLMVMSVMRVALKYIQAKGLDIGMTTPAGRFVNSSVRKKKVGNVQCY